MAALTGKSALEKEDDKLKKKNWGKKRILEGEKKESSFGRKKVFCAKRVRRKGEKKKKGLPPNKRGRTPPYPPGGKRKKKKNPLSPWLRGGKVPSAWVCRGMGEEGYKGCEKKKSRRA